MPPLTRKSARSALTPAFDRGRGNQGHATAATAQAHLPGFGNAARSVLRELQQVPAPAQPQPFPASVENAIGGLGGENWHTQFSPSTLPCLLISLLNLAPMIAPPGRSFLAVSGWLQPNHADGV